jgi:hypothetical protein
MNSTLETQKTVPVTLGIAGHERHSDHSTEQGTLREDDPSVVSDQET